MIIHNAPNMIPKIDQKLHLKSIFSYVKSSSMEIVDSILDLELQILKHYRDFPINIDEIIEILLDYFNSDDVTKSTLSIEFICQLIPYYQKQIYECFDVDLLCIIILEGIKNGDYKMKKYSLKLLNKLVKTYNINFIECLLSFDIFNLGITTIEYTCNIFSITYVEILINLCNFCKINNKYILILIDKTDSSNIIMFLSNYKTNNKELNEKIMFYINCFNELNDIVLLLK